MITFWIIAAGMILLALVFVLPPFFRKNHSSQINLDELNIAVIKQQLAELEADMANGELDEAQYAAARKDLERELLTDVSGSPNAAPTSNEKSGVWAVGIAAIGVPVLTIALYQALGNPALLTSTPTHSAGVAASQSPSDASTATSDNLPPMEVLVEKLAERLKNEPDNIEGWIMLARSYLAMENRQEAMNIFEALYERAPNNPQVLLNYAELLAYEKNNRLAGRPAELVQIAVELDPTNPNALWMMGLVHFQVDDYAAAIEQWKQLRSVLPPESEDANRISNLIAEASAKLATGETPPPQLTDASSKPTTSPAEGSKRTDASPAADKAIEVAVSLAPKFQNDVDPTDLVFIYARALQGPPMPLAAARQQVKDLPMRLTLDDSMAMMPQMVLSTFPQVVVGARISKSGNAIGQSGDLQGQVSPVTPGQSELVRIIIDSVRP